MNKEIRKISNISSIPVLAFVILAQGFSLLCSFLFKNLAESGIEISENIQIITTYSLIYIGGGAAVCLFYKLFSDKTGLQIKQIFRKPQRSVGWIIKWGIIAWGSSLGTSLFINLIIIIIKSVFKTDFYVPNLDIGQGALATVVTIIVFSIYAPVVEETLFRGTVYRHTERLGQLFAIVFSSVMFGLMHGTVNQVFYAFVMGLGLSFIFSKTRSVFPCIIIHFCVNTTSVILTKIIGSNTLQRIENLDYVKMIAASLLSQALFGIIIAALILLIKEIKKKSKRKIKLDSGSYEISGLKKTMIFISAPVTAVAIILMIIITVLNTLLR